MTIQITAKPKSKKEYIKRIGTARYAVAVHEPPVDGKANNAIIKALAIYLNKPVSQICIVSGEETKLKLVEIPLTLDELERLENNKVVQKRLL